MREKGGAQVKTAIGLLYRSIDFLESKFVRISSKRIDFSKKNLTYGPLLSFRVSLFQDTILPHVSRSLYVGFQPLKPLRSHTLLGLDRTISPYNTTC